MHPDYLEFPDKVTISEEARLLLTLEDIKDSLIRINNWLSMNLEKDESVVICKSCGCHYLKTKFWQHDFCNACSDVRTTMGPKARERNRNYGRNYHRQKKGKRE
jgi:hypothetical protein